MLLIQWRDRQGLSTASLAALCGVRRNAMHKIITGATLPRWTTIQAIITATGGEVTREDLQAAHAAAKAESAP